MKQEYCYFIAGGRTLAAIEAYRTAAAAHRSYMQELGAELGLPDLWEREGYVVGFGGFVVPDFMRRTRENPKILVPNRKTGMGREVLARMRAAPPVPSREWVMRAAGLEMTIHFINGRGFFPTCGWEPVGEHTIFILHADEKGEPRHGTPHDCERIPASRYWLLKESSEQG